LFKIPQNKTNKWRSIITTKNRRLSLVNIDNINENLIINHHKRSLKAAESNTIARTSKNERISKPLTNVSQKTVDAYYADFSANGVTVIPTPIGNVSDAHGPLPIYQTIGTEIKSRLKGASSSTSNKSTSTDFWNSITSWLD
jgi:hypothetical protein